MQVSEELGDKLKSTFGGSGLVVMKLLLLSASAVFPSSGYKRVYRFRFRIGLGVWGLGFIGSLGTKGCLSL